MKHYDYMTLYYGIYFLESVTAENVDAMEESEHPVIVTDTAQENDNAGLVRDKTMSQKRYSINISGAPLNRLCTQNELCNME